MIQTPAAMATSSQKTTNTGPDEWSTNWMGFRSTAGCAPSTGIACSTGAWAWSKKSIECPTFGVESLERGLLREEDLDLAIERPAVFVGAGRFELATRARRHAA
jgi:hypothetical protein